MIVELDRLDANINRIKSVLSGSDKTLRVATKSIRVPHLIEYVLSRGGPSFQGVMCFSPREALFLSRRGFDDLLIAYPRIQTEQLQSIETLVNDGIDGTVMIDETQHVDRLESFWSVNSKPLPVCVDIDVSLRPFDALHLGVQRSPLREPVQVEAMVDRVTDSSLLTFRGFMAYEAQIAGVPDESPHHPIKNYFVKGMKLLSRRDVANKRKLIYERIRSRGIEIDLFNGGGTGSLSSTVEQDCLTEVTVGSGFLQSHLFDGYANNENEPAFCFGLPVTRRPEDNIVTCQSGGFIASGPTGSDKTPRPVFPEGVKPIASEGYGEVQTPLREEGDVELSIGDPVFFRPAKAGEIAERFDEYVLVRNSSVQEIVPTYRGEGKTFY
jgi:D-serine deaminase-like pyridoxal phosphate-dependent protein